MVKKPEDMSSDELKVEVYDEGKKLAVLQKELEESVAMQKMRQLQSNLQFLENLIQKKEDGGKE